MRRRQKHEKRSFCFVIEFIAETPLASHTRCACQVDETLVLAVPWISFVADPPVDRRRSKGTSYILAASHAPTKALLD